VTRVYRLFCLAYLTLDLAAPVERAGAPLNHHHFLGLVAPAAAHQVAAVDADAGVVALSAVSAQDAEFRVLLAERRRWFDVDQVLGPWRLVFRVVRLQLDVVTLSASEATAVLMHGIAGRVAGDGVAAIAARIGHHHSGRAVEAVLEIVADQAEVWQPHPAGLHRARA